MRLASVALVITMAVGGVRACATVEGPKTPECPEGKYSVFVDKSTDPPTYSQTCKDPAIPTPPSPPSSPEPTPPLPSPKPSPTPTPEPSQTPSAVPSASPQPSPTPGPEWNDPDFVTVGDKPHNRIDNRETTVYVLNTTPRDSDGRPCQPDQRGCVYSRPEIRVWGPSFNGDQVVRSSRTSFSWEKPCERDSQGREERCYTNHYLPRIPVCKPGFSHDCTPPGRYEVCAAPRGKDARSGNCRIFDLRSQ